LITPKPLVSAIVVNWNGADDLAEALPSLVTQTYPNLEILIADNGSLDASETVVESFRAEWLPLGRNLGLAGAMNEGARVARGEFLLFLNNDMRFAPDFVEILVAVLGADPEVFAVDAKQFDWEGKEVVHACTTLRSGHRLRGDIPGWYFEQREATCPTLCVFGSAASLLVRKSMFEAVGGWDSKYPIGWEDVDLGWRAWARGWKCLYVPKAICWHRVGASSLTRGGSPARLWGTLYGRLRFALKNLPLPDATLLVAVTLGRVPFDLARGQINLAATRMKAVLRLVGEMPEILRARGLIRRSGGRSLRPFLAHLAHETRSEHEENVGWVSTD